MGTEAEHQRERGTTTSPALYLSSDEAGLPAWRVQPGIAFARRRAFSSVMATLTVYTLAQCSTCRDATKWLRARGLEFVERPIRETPPTLAELRTMLAHQRGEVRRLFNTSGQDYRAEGLKDRLPEMTEAEALALLAGNGRLVRRPFLLGPKVGLVGFDPKAWSAALG